MQDLLESQITKELAKNGITMEDLIGIIIFIVFAAISMVGNLAKKNQGSGESGGTSLKDILTTIKEELQGTSQSSETVQPEENGSKKKRTTKKQNESMAQIVEQIESTPKEKSLKQQDLNESTSNISVMKPIDLKQAIIWKEILDTPVSMR